MRGAASRIHINRGPAGPYLRSEKQGIESIHGAELPPRKQVEARFHLVIWKVLLLSTSAVSEHIEAMPVAHLYIRLIGSVYVSLSPSKERFTFRLCTHGASLGTAKLVHANEPMGTDATRWSHHESLNKVRTGVFRCVYSWYNRVERDSTEKYPFQGIVWC